MPVCSVCNQDSNRTVDLDGKVVCADCFTCRKCSKSLAGIQYGEKDGSLFCKDCFQKKEGKRCGVCHKLIDGQFAEVNGVIHCLDCFKCATCGKNIQGSYSAKDGKIQCIDCINGQAKKCKACGKKLEGPYVEVGGRPYHKECLKCTDCGETISGSYSQTKEGPLCKKCLKKKAKTCGGCGKRIVGSHYNVLDQFWHPDCLVCYCCHKPFKKGYLEHEGHLYHKECKGKDPLPGGPAPPKPQEEEKPQQQKQQKVEPQEPQEEADEEGFYSYKSLCNKPYPEGIDQSKREQFLSAAEFEKVFGMTKAKFNSMKKWKQNREKKKHGLF